MKQKSLRHSFLVMPFLFALVFLAGMISAKAVTIYGVTTANQLVRFDSATPGTVSAPQAITGLQTGENIVGIDFRPANGQLYGLGSSSRLYTINITTGAATIVGAAGAFTLTGTNFGFDFNPTVDRIRVVSDTGQNIRLNPDTGALAATDTNINPVGPTVTGAAYSNNTAGAATTTLYVIDTTLNTLDTQGGINGNPSPNGGTVTPVGPLGVIASGVNGFDIGSSNGVGYAALTVGGTSGLYTINLTTGTATLAGTFSGGTALRGLAVAFGTGVNGTSVLDFDGDRRTDFSVFRYSNSTWYTQGSSTGTTTQRQFGIAGTDTLAPADYDGDGKTDIAVYRDNIGTFFVLGSSDGTIQTRQFGIQGDEPVARDYDGDGKADFAVVRRTGGSMIWYILNSTNGTIRGDQFGLSTDVVAPGDYDGDGRFDLAVFRGGAGQPATFYVQRSTQGFTATQFGLGSDLVVPGDYDGDGKTDYAVVRQGSQYIWYILGSTAGFRAIQFGSKPFLTTQGDYDGDGRTDVSVWNPQNGVFYIFRSSNNTATFTQYGQNGDYPVANFDTH
jgi:Domain of unknown function (DUF4394)/FG-GAP-like repeat